ncbi:MAG: IclR family transcriptional regulator [Lachnospiraceae bacterium]|nr:IclR family transcriptional regulator [Candidatus Equihabitans merdae]
MDNTTKSSNQSVNKLLQLLGTLSEARMAMRLQDIAKDSGMPQATALRYLNALIEEGYAYQDEETGRYALTWKMCGFGDQIKSHTTLRTISGTLLSRLSVELGLGICQVIENDRECFYLDCIYEPSTVGHPLQRIGKQTPIHAASSGKILLTEYSDTDLDTLIEEKGLVKLTDRTISNKEDLVKELALTKERDYGLDDEECEEGLRCVAVPLRDYTGKAVAAISAFGDLDQMTEENIQQNILPALRNVAAEISMRMGSRGVI